LVDLKLCSESNVYKALAAQHNMEYVEVDRASIPPNASSLIPEDLMRKYLILPLGVEGGKLRIAVHDPLDLEMLDILRFRLHKEIRTSLAAKGRIKSVMDSMMNTTAANTIDKTMDQTIDRMRSSLDKTVDRSLDKSVDRSIDKSIDLDGMGGDISADATQAPIIKLVQAMIAEAVRNRASDIHIEPMKDRVRVRYRIDGECVERDRIPIKMKGPLISRIKIMAGIDIAEKRLPQDGRIKLRVDKADVDFRVSTLPAYHGESCVLRILRPDSVRIGIQNLGFDDDDYKTFQKIIKRPNGIFLVTGPTGSGKTTTLYGALNELNRPDRKIITAEDPVEYNFAGINQCQVRENIGLSFAKILRAMLRQAPNIILVGEIRDLEVAEVAIQAALTGHLVFSTLHTNSAAGILPRLLDMGIEPFLIASTVHTVIGQRLVRRIPEDHRESYQSDKTETEAVKTSIGALLPANEAEQKARAEDLGYESLPLKDQSAYTLYKGIDSPDTPGGYKGRMGLYEVFEVTEQIQDLILKRSTSTEIQKMAQSQGMVNMREDGYLKALAGKTTLAEVNRVAAIDNA
jgi:type IV pilus assembly protein PilB